MIDLPAAIARDLALEPETGMGYQIVTVILKDGRRYDQVVIVEGRLTTIRGLQHIPFSEDEIASVMLTHQKWDFSGDCQ